MRRALTVSSCFVMAVEQVFVLEIVSELSDAEFNGRLSGNVASRDVVKSTVMYVFMFKFLRILLRISNSINHIEAKSNNLYFILSRARRSGDKENNRR